MTNNTPVRQRHWSVLVFLVGFTALLTIVCFYYLKPAMLAAQSTTRPAEQRGLMAYSRLLLAVILFILLAGIMLTFRFGRLFFPRATTPRTRTQYVDAWAESAKRVEVPPADDESEG